MILNIKDCWNAAKNNHSKYFDIFVRNKINKFQSNLTVDVYDFIIVNHDRIRDGEESDFREIQDDFDKIWNNVPGADMQLVDSAIRKIFNYDSFSEKCKRRWCAYSACDEIGFKTCPYCNLSSEVTLWEDEEGLMRPSLDHFFDKDRYPLFAISLGNLIPCCHHCNSTYKGTKNFHSQAHLNPLYSEEQVKILLDVNISKARSNLTLFDSASVILNYDLNNVAVAHSVATFKILERYQALIEEVRDIGRNIVEYSVSGFQNPGYEGSVRRNVTDKNYRDRMYGKMILDMVKEYM